MIKFSKPLKTLVLSLVLTTFNSHSQTDYWQKLLENDREEALKLVSQLPQDDIETAIAKEIIRNESGLFDPSTDFVQKLSKIDDKEPYIYALWNRHFLFQDYLGNGFNKEVSKNIDLLYQQTYSSTSLRAGLDYIKAVKERSHNNFDEFKSIVSKIPAIREWQVCGVFENLNNSGLYRAYPPEEHAQSIGGFNANSNGIVDWYDPTWSKNHVYTFFENHNEYGSGVHYAQTFFEATDEKRVSIHVGASGKFKLFLDDIQIYENNENASTELDAYGVEVTIPKGNHRLLVKLANGSSGGYMLVRMKELDGSEVKNITFSKVFKEYIRPTEADLNPQELAHPVETFFETKLKQDPDNFLYSYCLATTYFRNQRYQKAKKILLPLEKKYPKSSIVRSLLIEAYLFEEDYSMISTIKENMQIDDESYFSALTYKFQDFQELMRMSMDDMSEFLDTYADGTDSKIIKASTEIIKAFRIEDKAKIRSSLDKLMLLSTENEEVFMMKSYAGLYKTVLNDEKKSIKILEKLNKTRFNTSVQNTLIRHYDKLNKYDKVLGIMQGNVNNMENDLSMYHDLIGYQHHLKRYNESSNYIKRGLELFPYSFILMDYDGDVALQTGKVDLALENYRKSLLHNSGNSGLRRKVRDISGDIDLIEKNITPKIYDYISEKRAKIKENNYGYNILLDEAVVELYSEAGGRGRYNLIYEVTTESGVESIKEFSLGLSGSYEIISSEIVKPNGELVPADRSGSNFVFEGLKVGDVINIQYQTNFNSSGRFYKDFVDSYQFDSYHPVSLSKYMLIAPKDQEITYVISGEDNIPVVQASTETHNTYTWTIENDEGLPQSEDYMPEMSDVSRTLHISTIDNWNEIAMWYSDLVRSQLIINSDVRTAFDECFEDKDMDALTEKEKAKTIYDYMMNRLNYSFVPFRQSGFVPQKPARTLTTNLGDCKDFSSLFVLFTRMAGLESNLILVLTADNGENDLILPSTDFNHCIAKLTIDNQAQYVELTNKRLPFEALPRTLFNARSLEIPYYEKDQVKEYELYPLSNLSRMKNTVEYHVDMKIDDDEKKITIESTMGGDSRTYYSEVLEDPNKKTIEEEILDQFSGSIKGSLEIDSVYNIKNNRDENTTKYTCDFTVKDKANKIGSFKVLELPTVSNAYTADIVRETERLFPINYVSYESIDDYKITYDIYLKDGEEFVELPENVSLSYKKHSYIRTYEKISSNHLRVSVHAIPDLATITPEEYSAFKTYVNKVLEAKDEFVGYK